MGQLTTLRIQPGLYTDETAVGAEPYWHDCNLVRFRNNLAEQMGGWVKLSDNDKPALKVIGLARAIHDWSSLDSQQWVAIGTHLKLYVINGGNLYDITPLRAEGTIKSGSITVSGSTATIKHKSHGLNKGDFIHLDRVSRKESSPRVIGEYQVKKVVSIDEYTIDTSASIGDGKVNSTDGPAAFKYEIPVGKGSREKVFGFGVGPYSDGTYGTPRKTSSLYEGLRTWSLDNWGEDLMASPVDGPVYIWDRSSGPNTRATIIEAAPATNKWISVSPEDRHLICFGAHTTRTRDPMLIRWSDQENYNDFLPSETNSAGDKRLDSGSRIITAMDTRGEKLIFTDEAIYGMQFIGGQDVYAFTPLGRSVTIIGQNAAAQVNGIVFLMGNDDFLIYDGVIQTMACPIRNHVFDDINIEQGAKVYASVNRTHTEIIWLYPSADSDENDRYAIYNYREKLWYFGYMKRTAFHDESASFRSPYAASPNGQMYRHEEGHTADGKRLDSFLQSYDIDLGDGQEFLHIQRMIPDFISISGGMELTLISRQYPQIGSSIEKGPYPFNAGTKKISVRARNRQIALRVAAATIGCYWRMGHWRAEVVGSGQR